MSEGGGEGSSKQQVRVVRCPKCEKLLPEPTDCTFYRCGGCDATLQAKSQNGAIESSFCTSGEERIEKHENPEKISMDVPDFRPDGMAASDSSLESEESKVRETGKIANEVPETVSADERAKSMADLAKEDAQCSTRTSLETRPLGGCERALQMQHSKKGEGRRDGCSFHRTAPTIRMDDTRSGHAFIDEGPSNYQPKRIIDGAHRVDQSLEQDRIELLRKLDDLREQLGRSCDITDEPKEQPPTHKRVVSSGPYGNHGYGSWFPEGSSSLDRASSRRAPYLDEYNMDMPNFYPAMRPNDIPLYQEPFMAKAVATHHPRRVQNSFLYNQLEPNHVISYHHDGFYHQPACSCLHFHNRPCTHPGLASTGFPMNQHSHYLVDDPRVYPVEAPHTFGHRNGNLRADIGVHPYDLRQANRKATFGRKNGRPCRPVAGAAPFVVCHNCFKVLQFPPKPLLGRKNRWKLRCGSCSEVVFFELDGRRLVTVVQEPARHMSSSNNDGRPDRMRDSSRVYRSSNNYPVTSHSGEYDNASSDYSADEKLILPPFSKFSRELLVKECGLNSSDSEKMQGISSCSSTSEGADSPGNIISKGDAALSTALPLKTETTSLAQGLPLHEYFGYPASSDHVTNGPGKGSRSRRSNQEKIVTISGNFRKNSVKDVPVATEMDLSTDDYSNHSLSQDSLEANKGECPKSKGGESFFAALIKKGFKDLRSNQTINNRRSKVYINGHHIPDRLVKKAEKQAGAIQPREYWYDYHAGFWGISGHPCLGIIPPFIEEFNYPMPRGCAGGNTGVIVNGRELHRNDLDLLSGRGLPTSPGRSYIITISGKVWDEASGEELESLGKLAPTVEIVKRGFGMGLPRIQCLSESRSWKVRRGELLDQKLHVGTRRMQRIES